MHPAPESEPILRTTAPPTNGVWGARNYHSTLERRAIAGSEMTWGYVAMVVASAVLATAGLLLDSAAVVIGSMCVAPFMAPSRAVCLGAIFRQPRVLTGGLIKQVVGLLLIGSGIGFMLTLALSQGFELSLTHEIMLRAMPTPKDFVLSAIIAFSAGAAASLALVAEPRLMGTPWGQVVDAVIGVEIAISLIPPAAVIGIGLAMGLPEHSLRAFELLLLNVVFLDLIGSTLILGIRGIDRHHLDREKHVRATVANTLDVVPGFVSVGSTVDVTLLDPYEVRIYAVVRRRFGGQVPPTLAEQIADDLRRIVGVRSSVTVEVIPLLTHSILTGAPVAEQDMLRD